MSSIRSIQLMPYERCCLEAVQQKLGLDRKMVLEFASALEAFWNLFQALTASEEVEFMAGRVVLIGDRSSQPDSPSSLGSSFIRPHPSR